MPVVQLNLQKDKLQSIFDWSVFISGMTSLIFAISMTLVSSGETRIANFDSQSEIPASL